ncbi:MAG TPA: hypothetical protein VF520_01635 [Thermoleophilaceae bacterium]|jgi:hypothetical protein
MANDPWTAREPQPGDFDAELAAIDPRDVQVVEAGAGTKVAILVKVEGDDAIRLERLAAARRQRPSEVVAALLRNA